jgi:hypothetical protein
MNERSDQPGDQHTDLPADLRYPTDAGDGQEIPARNGSDEGKTPDDQVEEASEDSFPASDPPSYTGGSTS